MPLYIPDDPVIVLFELLGTIFASISYGIVIVLSGNSFHLFQKKRGIYSNRVRILLIIYVILMLQLITWTLIRLIWCIIGSISSSGNQSRASLFTFFLFELPFIIWGADRSMVRIIILRREKIYRYAVLSRLVSGRFQRPGVVTIILLSFISFTSLGRSISIPPLPFKLVMKNMSIRCWRVSPRRDTDRQAGVRRASVQFTLRSCKHHTRSADRFPICLPSETRPRCPWSAKWISPHQRYRHARRIFSTDHCRWPVHYSVFRASVAVRSKIHVRHHRS